MKEINQNIKDLIELSKCENLTLNQFKRILNFTSYDLMVSVLNGTRYPAKRDYTYMTSEQAETIELIEQMSDIRRKFEDKVEDIARKNLKNYCSKEYPDKVHLIDWHYLNWGNLEAIYKMYTNNFELPLSL